MKRQSNGKIQTVTLNKRILFHIFIIPFILLCFSFPQDADAHAILEKATPNPDSHLLTSPREIVLVFNERLEDELFSIKVFNNQGKSISNSKTELSVDRKQLSYTLPNLGSGSYTVSYTVLSADGHPIRESYIFSIGEKPSGNVVIQDAVKSEKNSIFTLIVNIIYYLSLLFLTGWILWEAIRKRKLPITSFNKKMAIYLQIAFLVANVGVGLVQLNEFGWDNIGPLLTGTTIGISWSVSMLLSILGFALLLRFTWLDSTWAVLLLVSKSINGHAMAFDPPLLTISIDFIHLLAAAIWAGGLLNIVLYWKKQREQMSQFLAIFSKIALLSMIILTLTGTALTLTYLPKLNYLLYTNWGIWLLIKMAIVLFVIVIGSFLRFYLKNKNEVSFGKLVKLDFTFMIVIVCIVGIFTRLSPLPQNEALVWKEKNSHIEFTANISPKAPGDNMFMVEATSITEGVKIKRIELFIKNNDKQDVAPIQVLFPKYEQASKVHYMADGSYLPFRGNWTVEIRILDSDDNESVYRKHLRVY